MATEGFDCSGEESSDVESSSDDSLVEEELTFMEGEVESRERVLVRKSVRFYKSIIATALYKVCWCSRSSFVNAFVRLSIQSIFSGNLLKRLFESCVRILPLALTCQDRSTLMLIDLSICGWDMGDTFMMQRLMHVSLNTGVQC